uniref:odorant receptor 131-2-like n=1 Tax=Gasterosteus aculeatus aculeatus TaxID=481459 RepID=UPI001A982904|nr:odorant receptor 131-2-like [Gasterosteus aculeatus aculeatus]
MAANNSVVGVESPTYKINYRLVVVQVLVSVFLFINFLLIRTFFVKDFYTTMRYILFATTLLSDSLFLIITDILLIFSYIKITMQVWLCVIIFIVSSLYTFVTPVTLTAMTLERYVAVCRPLRHGELCSTRRALHCVLIIHSLSAIPCVFILAAFFASASHNFYSQGRECGVEIFTFHKWQGHLRSAVSQFYFFIMFIAIVFCYVKIMKVAKAASGEDKKSTRKGLKTVIFHAFQLSLCLFHLWCPFIEAAVFQINLILFINVRYFNYIAFILAPRCISPLVYGLRDEMFFHALKYYALCGLYKKQSPNVP